MEAVKEGCEVGGRKEPCGLWCAGCTVPVRVMRCTNHSKGQLWWTGGPPGEGGPAGMERVFAIMCQTWLETVEQALKPIHILTYQGISLVSAKSAYDNVTEELFVLTLLSSLLPCRV